MSRTYINIRLAYETKYWLECIQEEVQKKLDALINEQDIEELESIITNKLEKKDSLLGAVSITTFFKVSSSSVIEKAYNETKNYTTSEWREIARQMNLAKVKQNMEIGTLTPRLYLDNNIISELEKYQFLFKSDDMIRQVRMSYVIKMVAFAYYKKLFAWFISSIIRAYKNTTFVCVNETFKLFNRKENILIGASPIIYLTTLNKN